MGQPFSDSIPYESRRRVELVCHDGLVLELEFVCVSKICNCHKEMLYCELRWRHKAVRKLSFLTALWIEVTGIFELHAANKRAQKSKQ